MFTFVRSNDTNFDNLFFVIFVTIFSMKFTAVSEKEVVNSCPDPGLGYYPEGQGPDIKGKMVLG